MRESGCLIAFEGIEGAGKSTQLRLAAGALRRRGIGVVETREPGGTALGNELRRILMHLPETPPTPLAELLLYLADRAQHVADVILPAITQGQVVLTDRFSASTLAYQGYARTLDLEMVSRLDAIARQGVEPLLTVLLDCPVAVGLRRARGDDRFHREEQEFHERVRNGFLSQARQDPDHYCVVDATGLPDDVQHAVEAAVTQCLTRP
ncbi:MAG TPA: dTMP kinase [Candidatus Acidoferrales bacterium]|nr:dTMP kinase [Candidatus Acidoferrales bacterium]